MPLGASLLLMLPLPISSAGLTLDCWGLILLPSLSCLLQSGKDNCLYFRLELIQLSAP